MVNNISPGSGNADTVEDDKETSPAVVIVARHGERLDYIMRDAGDNWIAQAERPWDPPLSDHGLEQGAKLGQHLQLELERLGLPPVSAIYTSPFLRCRQTAAFAMHGYSKNDTDKDATTTNQLPPVRIEQGLAESINESWYRSWALPGSNGTWGFHPPGQDIIDPVSLHPASKQPALSLLDWKAKLLSNPCSTGASFDMNYVSITTLKSSYSFYPKVLESRNDQRLRMMETVSQLAQPNTTVLLVSHGGPVTHLYEGMTGNNWNVHGESSYCCYSIYKKVAAAEGDKEWEALSVNESKYLDEKLTTERHVSEGY
jgi:broad specificity phosphatase PhoE